MKDRQVVWSDEKVRELAEEFVPVTVDTNVVRFAGGAEGEWFRGVADAGHFGSQGGARSVGTQQGIYLATPEGELLASGNQQDASYTVDLMRTSLQEFRKTLEAFDSGNEAILTVASGADESQAKAKAVPPAGGLVLDVVLRQIYPRPLRTSPGSARLHLDDRASLTPMEQMQVQRIEMFSARKSEEYWHVPWNRDRAWFTKEEMRQFIPRDLEAGRSTEVAPELVDRLARLHCTDTVRAIADLYPEDSLKEATLKSTIVSVKGELVTLTLEGRIHLKQEGIAMLERGSDRSAIVPKKPQRSYEAELLGRARYDRSSGQFTDFEMIALGPKTGGSMLSPFEETQFAVAFQLVSDPEEQAKQEPRYLRFYPETFHQPEREEGVASK